MILERWLDVVQRGLIISTELGRMWMVWPIALTNGIDWFDWIQCIYLRWLCMPIFKVVDGHIVAQLFVKSYKLTKLWNCWKKKNGAKSKKIPKVGQSFLNMYILVVLNEETN